VRMASKAQSTELDQSKAITGMLALLVAEREERINDRSEPRKTEVILADAGLSIGEIASLTGKNYDTVKTTIRRGRKK
jgi:DNA-directed RNA polymerase specialized sigma24 family protein